MDNLDKKILRRFWCMQILQYCIRKKINGKIYTHKDIIEQVENDGTDSDIKDIVPEYDTILNLLKNNKIKELENYIRNLFKK